MLSFVQKLNRWSPKVSVDFLLINAPYATDVWWMINLDSRITFKNLRPTPFLLNPITIWPHQLIWFAVFFRVLHLGYQSDGKKKSVNYAAVATNWVLHTFLNVMDFEINTLNAATFFFQANRSIEIDLQSLACIISSSAHISICLWFI